MSESRISLRNLHQSFGQRTILQDISLEVGGSTIFGILGPSGAGKTTLIKIIAGIDQPSSGEVYLFGQRMPQFALMSRIGFMAQSDALYSELTALENLQFFASLYGLKGPQQAQRIKAVMELVQLEDDLHKQIFKYSGGMKRRLSLAISLLHKPEILLLDEPTVGIDPILRQQVWQELRSLSKQGTTLIITTHVMDEADKCDQIGMLRGGTWIAVGTPDELKEKANASTIEEAFLHFGGVKR